MYCAFIFLFFFYCFDIDFDIYFGAMLHNLNTVRADETKSKRVEYMNIEKNKVI